jgi:hypothetical protein
MTPKRQKITISLYDQDLLTIEQLEKRFTDQELAFAPTTSEVVRIALQVVLTASNSKLEKAIANIPDRKTGRPKRDDPVW